MCTVSAWADSCGYRLYFNRDEQRSRSRADPPRGEVTTEGLAILAPRDPDGGGTWLAVNAEGLAVGLINYYHAGNFPDPGERQVRSRGELVDHLSRERTLKDAGARLQNRALAAYRPFECFAIAPGPAGLIWRWNGQSLIREEIGGWPWFMASSSYRSLEVIASRRSAFDSWRRIEAAGDPMVYHASPGLEPDAFTPLMRRDDARTLSITVVTVEAEAIRMEYHEVEESGTLAPAVNGSLAPDFRRQ